MALTSQDFTTIHLLISGRVQGVGYRDWMQRAARRLGLKGWVRNLADGRVEAVVEGHVVGVNELIKECQSGPALAKVTGVDTKPITTYDVFSTFEQRETTKPAT